MKQQQAVAFGLTTISGAVTKRVLLASRFVTEENKILIRTANPVTSPSVTFRVFANHKQDTFTDATRAAAWKQLGTDVIYTAAAGPDVYLVDSYPFYGIELVGGTAGALDFPDDIQLVGLTED